MLRFCFVVFLITLLPIKSLPGDELAFRLNESLSPGINLGGYFDGETFQEPGLEDLERIKQRGFRSVRLPVRWSAHIAGETIELRFLDAVRRTVDRCLSSGLRVVLNVHHFHEMNEEPDQYEDFLVALWRMIAREFAGVDERLILELFNEPQKALDVDRWNTCLARLHSAIRSEAPDRTLMIGSAEYNGWWTLNRLQLPAADRNIIVSVHYYSPMEFTHQGAEWLDDRKNDPPTKWNDPKSMLKDFEAIRQYALTSKRPINIGEFGVYRRIAPADSTAAWVGSIASLCRQAGFSFHYWEYNAGFGLYRNGRWDERVTRQLFPPLPAVQ